MIGWLYAVILFSVFVWIWRQYHQTVKDLSLSLLIYIMYGTIQWLLCIVLIVDVRLYIIGTIGVILLLHYALFSHLILKRYQVNIALESFTDDLQHFDQTFLAIRTERHDYVRHIHVLHHLLEDKQFSQAKDYLTLIEDYEDVNQSIKREQGHIASVLYQCRLRASNANVHVNYQLEHPLSSLPLQTADQVNLLSNLLNNAVDAAEQSDADRKEITLITSLYSGFYKLDLQNTSKRPPDHILDHLFEKFGITTKGGHHEGLGTYIIADIIERYGGSIDHIYDDGKMTVRIHLPVLNRF